MVSLRQPLAFAVLTATAVGCGGGDKPTAPPPPPPPVVTTVEVAPANASVVAPGTVTLGATVKDQNGATMSGKTVAWSSSDVAVATVSADGQVAVVRAGTATITAAVEGRSGSATITGLAPVAAVSIRPDSIVMSAGDTVTLAAVLRDAAGNTLTGRTVTWTSPDPSVATVSSTGLLSAVGAGRILVLARAESASTRMQVTVSRAAAQLPAVSCTSCLELVPSSALLRQVGDQQLIEAYQVDAQGRRTRVRPTWRSSTPAEASVDADGLVTARTATGSAQVIATANGLTSAPAMVVMAAPVAGAMVISDAQVVGAITPVDSAAQYGLGFRYRVRLRNATPTVGQVVLSGESLPVGGRVVSVTSAGTNLVDVVLEVVPLRNMVTGMKLNQKLPLKNAKVTVPSSVQEAFAVQRGVDGAITLTPRTRRPFTTMARPSSASRAGPTFSLGIFDCEASAMAGVGFPIALVVTTATITHSLTLDVGMNGLSPERFLVTGAVDAAFEASPSITASFNADVKCKAPVATLILPIGGFLSTILAGEVPLSLLLNAKASTTVGPLGFDLSVGAAASVTAGWNCTPTCNTVGDVTNSGSLLFQPILPNANNVPPIGLAVGAGLGADLNFANPAVSSAVKISLLSLSATGEQSLTLAAADSQRANPAFAGGFSLSTQLGAKAGASVSLLGGLVSLNLVSFQDKLTIAKLAGSPVGRFSISPATVAAGTQRALGDTATFTVTMDTVNYLGAYAVEGIELLWYKRDAGGNLSLQPGRPGCTSLRPTAAGQRVFNCTTDFVQADTGQQVFYAFAKTRLFGRSIPFLMEINNDARATVNVVNPSVRITPRTVSLGASATQQFTATVNGQPNRPVVWTASAGTMTGTGLFTAPNQPGTTVRVIATSVEFAGVADTATVTVTTRPLGFTGLPPGGGVVGVALTPTQFAPFGGVGGYVFSATNLPPGLSLSAQGVLSGVPSSPGNFTLAVRLTSGSESVVQSFPFNVVQIAVHPWIGRWTFNYTPNNPRSGFAFSTVVVINQGTQGPNRFMMDFGFGDACFIVVVNPNTPGTFSGNCTQGNNSINGTNAGGTSMTGSITAPNRPVNFGPGTFSMSRLP